MFEKLRYLLCGLAMGAADVVPGVSGGTIAYITGIYDQLLNAIKAFNAAFFRDFFTGQWKRALGRVPWGFLLPLLLGVGTSIFSLAKLTLYLLKAYPHELWAFFFGLIVASSIFILRGISGWALREVLLLVLGIILGIVICTLSPTQTPDGLWFIFLSGALAICAMILPGISGSFILLILGKYQYIMGCISDLVSGVNFAQNFLILCIFGIGAIVGILGFSKFLHWLLARWQKETMIVLAGFIIGSLVKVWPWNNMEAIVTSQFPNVASLSESLGGTLPAEIVAQYAEHINPHTTSAFAFALIGFFLVTGIELAGKKIANKKSA